MFYFLWMLACCLVFLGVLHLFIIVLHQTLVHIIVSAHDFFWLHSFHFSEFFFYLLFFCSLYTLVFFFSPRCLDTSLLATILFFILLLFQPFFFFPPLFFFSFFFFLYPISPPIISTCYQFYRLHNSL